MSPRQLFFELEPYEETSRRTFINSPSHQEALAWIDRWPNWSHACLSIYGPPGSGKSHLGHIWHLKTGAFLLTPDQAVVYSPLEWLPQNRYFVLDFPEVFPSSHQQWLFHFYNCLIEQQGQAFFLSRFPMAQWPVTLADLASRLKTIPSVKITEPDDTTLRLLLEKKFQDKALSLKPDILDYLIHRMDRSFSEVGRIVETLDAYLLTHQRSLTLPCVKKALGY